MSLGFLWRIGHMCQVLVGQLVLVWARAPSCEALGRQEGHVFPGQFCTESADNQAGEFVQSEAQIPDPEFRQTRKHLQGACRLLRPASLLESPC